jgi:hypothetical protein
MTRYSREAENASWHLETLANAQALAERYGLFAMDAAYIAQVDETIGAPL